jgi:hypothetical protein
MKKTFLLLTSIVFLAIGCKKEDSANTFKSASQNLGEGKVFTWVKFSDDDVATSVGFTLTKGALDNLPHSGVDLELNFPDKAIGKIPFDHILLNFLHEGHEPPGTYDVAHFDMHFYFQSSAERKAIPPYAGAAIAKFDNLPADGYIPQPYFRLPGGVPGMGVHWADPTSQELAGTGKFDQTLIYGSYDGKLTFIEPMVTLEFLNSKPNFSKNIPQPSKFANSGLFPLKYSIKQVGNNVEVSLDDLMMR